LGVFGVVVVIRRRKAVFEDRVMQAGMVESFPRAGPKAGFFKGGFFFWLRLF
jgi:hypothetical protein